MASGSLKEYVRAVADGFVMPNATNLKKYGQGDQLRELHVMLNIVERETRAEQIEEEDFEGTRKKHFRLGNLRKAKLVVQGFAKSHRIPL